MIKYLSHRARDDGISVGFPYKLAYKEFDTSYEVYAPIGLHLLARGWKKLKELRWSIYQWGIDNSILALKEKCGYYTDCKITPREHWFSKSKMHQLYWTKYGNEMYFYWDTKI
jgi:hypothetical protein